MARIKGPKSTRTFGGLGLSKSEDDKLVRLLKDKISLTKLKRALIRAWIANPGIIDLNK